MLEKDLKTLKIMIILVVFREMKTKLNKKSYAELFQQHINQPQ